MRDASDNLNAAFAASPNVSIVKPESVALLSTALCKIGVGAGVGGCVGARVGAGVGVGVGIGVGTTGTTMQAVCATDSFVNVPVAHAVHVARPGAVANVSTPHGRHAVLFGVSA